MSIKKSGIIFFTKKDGEYFVPLFLNNRFSTYVSLGGTFDNKDKDLMNTAIRETLEESFCSIDIDKDFFKNYKYFENEFDFNYDDRKKNIKYKIFYIFLDFNIYKMIESSYYKNKNYMKGNKRNNDRCFYETSNIKLFNLKHFNKFIDDDYFIKEKKKTFTIWKFTYYKVKFLVDKLNLDNEQYKKETDLLKNLLKIKTEIKLLSQLENNNIFWEHILGKYTNSICLI